jgi:hypothetical protein
MPIDSIEELQTAVEQVGLATTIMRNLRFPRLVCATMKRESGLHGNSLWLACLDDSWYISTWTSATYQVPAGADLVSLCRDCVGCAPSAISRIPDELTQGYGLKEVHDDHLFDTAS